LQTREFDTLESWFGDANINANGLRILNLFKSYWAEGWTFFSRGQNETIVCQNIFAHVSQECKVTNDGEIVPMGAAKVNNMTYSESVFRPANPDSDEECRMYPSESDKYKARLAEENARIDACPEPLRGLLKARHTSDDSDLLAYKAAINRFRAKPDSLLIRQLVERLDDRTSVMSVLSEMLMDAGAGTNYLKLDPWKSENKKIAIEALIDSLPEAPLKDVESVIIIILAETNLVTLKMAEPEFSINVRAFPRTPTSRGHGGDYESLRIKNEMARKTILNRIASELRRRWEASGFCVERYSATAVEK